MNAWQTGVLASWQTPDALLPPRPRPIATLSSLPIVGHAPSRKLMMQALRAWVVPAPSYRDAPPFRVYPGLRPGASSRTVTAASAARVVTPPG